uniref:Chondroitin proteoglycan 4 domain-containing protein n=1 Tax=Caenorhabditis japonica TaxID=281687 RepID=A0A8R1I169_CAEJA
MRIPSIIFVLLSHFLVTLDGRATSEQLDQKLGAGMKHVSCQMRVTGFYMRRHCKKHFNTTLRCDLNVHERRAVKKVAKVCCEDAPSCDPTELFSEFCCHDTDCKDNEAVCHPWDESIEEIELANLVFSSETVFENIQQRIIEQLKMGNKPDYFPQVLDIYFNNPELIDESETSLRRYFKSHRLQTAHIAKSLGIIQRRDDQIRI